MNRLGAMVARIAVCVVCLALIQPGRAEAAGAVEMQVEHIVVQSIDVYNQAMEANNPEEWLRYFTDNVRRHGPLSDQQGKKEFTDYVDWEFKNFLAKCVVKKMVVSGRSVAVVFLWDAVHKASSTPLQIEMAAVYDMASSGRFESISFYFDTAKAGKLLADSMVKTK